MLEPIKTVPWAEEQVKTSWAPVEPRVPAGTQDLVVSSGPALRHLHRGRMGLRRPGEPSPPNDADDGDGEAPPIRTASRSTDVDISREDRPASESRATSSAGSTHSPASGGTTRLDPENEKPSA